MSYPKTTCPITRTAFADSAMPLEVVIAGNRYAAEPKQFSTGSMGWSVTTKVTVEVAGKLVTVQVGLNLTVVGSKELPRDAAAA